jgi:hypothetical protein
LKNNTNQTHHKTYEKKKKINSITIMDIEK